MRRRGPPLRASRTAGERLEVELDGVDRAPRQLGLLGGGHRQAVADEPHHPRQQPLLVSGGEHRGDAREGARGRGVGPHHPRVGEGRAPQGQVQRAGQREVAGEGGLAGGAAQAHGSLLRGGGGGGEHGGHGLGVAGAAAEAGQRVPAPRPRSGSARRRAGRARRGRAPACRSRTGTRPPRRTPTWSGCGRSAVPSPSTVRTVRPWALTASVRQDATGRPSRRTVHAPQRPVPQPAFTPKMPAPRSRSRRVVRASASARSTRPLTVSSSRPEVK